MPRRVPPRRPAEGLGLVGEATAGAAICGLGMSRLGRVFGASPRRLAASAVRLAVADAGLQVADLDGLLICPGITGGLDVGLAQQLGMRDLSLLAVVNSFGASAVAAVQIASLAVSSGSARAVACVFADTPLRDGAPAGSAFGAGGTGPAERHGLHGLAAGYGFSSVTAWYALAARRHMERYGTTSEQLGAIAVAQREWAAGNPLAQFRDPITLADHQGSRFVAEPLHLLDCSLVSNGAVAVIVATAAAAAGGPARPVHVWGWGQGHPGRPMAAGGDFGLVTGAAQAGRQALGMAGIGPGDVTMCQIYDCYTYTVLVTLEDYGFCAKGEGGPFAASGALAPGGSLPVNTGGGQLSAYYMWGFTPLSEAIIQARGAGGDRQSPAADVIMVSGNGGILDHHGTLVLSPHRRDARPAGPPVPPSAGRTGRTGADGRDAARPASPRPASPRPASPRPASPRPASPGPAAAAAGTASAGAAAAGSGTRWPDGVGVVRADERSAPFFSAAGRGELLAKRCGRCGGWRGPVASECPDCGDAGKLEWAAASGAGTLVSWSVIHARTGGAVAVPALVELAEGPWIAAGLRLAGPGDLPSLRAGLPVRAEFVTPRDGESYPVFCPADQPG